MCELAPVAIAAVALLPEPALPLGLGARRRAVAVGRGVEEAGLVPKGVGGLHFGPVVGGVVAEAATVATIPTIHGELLVSFKPCAQRLGIYGNE